MKKTIGILAHVDAGKTTFSEQLLFHTKTIRKRGRVDHQSAFLDNHEIEKQRGITVFADQAIFHYKDSTYYLIDTPGHVDFSPEMERAIQVMDFAIIIISAVEGIEGHTETVWKLLKKHHVPTFFFINKTDRTGGNVEKVLKEIRNNLTGDVLNINSCAIKNSFDEEIIDFVAERDEKLFDYYMAQGFNHNLWVETMQTMIRECNLFPCISGSALQDIGIEDFIDKFDYLTTTNYNEKEGFSGRVYKIRYDETGTRMTFIKALSGTLNIRDEVAYGDADNKVTEKITQIRTYNGNHFETVQQVYAGELFAVTGLAKAATGDGVGTLFEKRSFEMIPTLRSRVVFGPLVNVKEALKYFTILDSEDPSLKVTWEEQLQQIHIHVMGAIQLEVLKQVVLGRFGLQIEFDKPEIIYKETVETSVTGYGHFEPLKHYAEVHLKIEPAPRNSGIQFKSICHTDHLSIGLQNLVKQHIYEREHHGLLTGSGLTDVTITLLTGRDHNRHTHGGDFREATFRAIRQGLEKANNRLLEPYYQFKIKVDMDQMGRVLTDIQTAHGKFETPIIDGDRVIITGKVPVSTFMEYTTTLASFTKGKGSISLDFAGYDICHNELEVVESIGYDKDSDPMYTSSSVFCSRGAGYSVRWDKAEKMMHCQ
ncbi:translation factor GTPase family protein [Paucisalibacillus sp. EB02]|uniref:elongation factor G n=1 Tax=Paucisalibacillus sp. EB02 TaxID=1347087 RepID=UPI0005A9ECCF|nr:TetM/TetW/TetO/TetS family tetracycline resistance ribosomal protection protein [Paucisalibacillus sp. EB02]